MNKIVYSWVTIISPVPRAKRDAVAPRRIECRWSMVGANGEYMCGGEGHRDEADARRAFRAVMTACGAEPMAAVNMYFKEVGPGPKPE